MRDRIGKENVILLNHDISIKAEDADIKRFKQDVADYLDLPITPANMPGWEDKHPLEVCMDIGAFKVGNGTALCTNRLKIEPFMKYLKKNFPSKPFDLRNDITAIYGFDKQEIDRIQRRTGVMISLGYKTDYPLALWDRTIETTESIGIPRPSTYKIYRHANCTGCLKAGKQHWYIVFCTRPDIWELGKRAEQEIGYSIINGEYLKEMEPLFQKMKCYGIVPTQKIKPQAFWARVNKFIPDGQELLPCECAL
jgi:hypothetical protein